MQIENPKILSIHEMRAQRDKLVAEGKKLVFTNGCFDILHRGHVSYLTFARNQGDALVVAVNTDASVKVNKGDERPINTEEDRAFCSCFAARGGLRGDVRRPGTQRNHC